MRARLVSIPFIASLLLVGSHTLTAQHDADALLAGTWTINVAKSQFRPEAVAPQRLTTTFRVVDGQLFAAIDSIDFQGRRVRSEYVVRFDGKDYPWSATVDGQPDVEQDTVAWRRLSPYRYEVVNKLRGETISTLTVEIARDGRTRTTTARGNAIANRIVFEKQQLSATTH